MIVIEIIEQTDATEVAKRITLSKDWQREVELCS